MKRAARWALPLLPLIALVLMFEAYGQGEKKEGSAVGRILGRKSGKTEPPPPAAEKSAAPAPVAAEPASEPSSEPTSAPSSVSEEGDAESVESATGFMSKDGGQVKIDLGSEADEPTSVKNIFKEDKEIQDTFKDAVFIYDAEGIADPMIFPPIRNEAIRDEMWLKHENILKEAGGDPTDGKTNQSIDPLKAQEALDCLTKIADLKDARFTVAIEDRIALLGPYAKKGPTPPGEEPDVPPLPKEIIDGFKGVVYNANGSICLIGDQLVKLGETVPDYDFVKVIALEPNKAVLQCSNADGSKTEDHTLEVGDFTNFSFWGDK